MFLDWLSENEPTNPRFCLPAHWNARNSLFGDGKTGTVNSFQALNLILQPGLDDKLEVEHYESSIESVEDEDFAEDVPKIDGNPEYETDKDCKLNDEAGANDGGEENCFVLEVKKTVLFTFFKAPQKTSKQCCWQTRKRQYKRGNPNLLSATNVMFTCCFYILWHFF